MDSTLLGGEPSTDHLVLCSQEGFMAQPFGSNDYSTDSSSTQLTGGFGGSNQNFNGHLSYTLINGGQQSFRPELSIDTETALGFFDESSGFYGTAPIPSQGPYTDRNLTNLGGPGAALSSFKTPPSFGYNTFSEPGGSVSCSNGAFGDKESSLFLPNVCQAGSVELSPWERMTPAQLNVESQGSNNGFSLAEFDPSLFAQTTPSSGSFPSLSEQPLNIDPPSFSCRSGLVEPTLTSPATSWWNHPTTSAATGSIKEETATTVKERQTQRQSENASSGVKGRWKPNTTQLCLLEQHFRTGYTKPTPELFVAAKEAGPATEPQVSVWLKNRLARCKRYTDKETEPRSDESSNFETDFLSSAMTGNKRERQEEECYEDFTSVQSVVLDELSGILQSVDSQAMKGLARAIRDANNIVCYGVSREGLAMKAFAVNLHHLGFKAFSVGDTSTPPLNQGDLFLVAAGPSYYSTVSALSLEAMRSGAHVIAFTAHRTAPLPFAESVIRIASQTLPPCMPVMNRKLGGMTSEIVSSLPDGRFSCMQMGASFEVALSLVLESLCVMIRKKLAISLKDVARRRTNLS